MLASWRCQLDRPLGWSTSCEAARGRSSGRTPQHEGAQGGLGLSREASGSRGTERSRAVAGALPVDYDTWFTPATTVFSTWDPSTRRTVRCRAGGHMVL